MPLFTEQEFRDNVLPLKLHNDPLVDANIFDIIFSYNQFSSWSEAFTVACLNNHPQMAQVMWEMGATDLRWGIIAACEKEFIPLIKMFIETGMIHVNDVFTVACGRNLLVSQWIWFQYKDKINIESGFLNACFYSQKDVAEFLIQHGASDFESGLACAYCNKNHEFIEWLDSNYMQKK